MARIAIVGSGPAGFYAAGFLLRAGAEVDLIERLPTPWGLVRSGVAPDHPKLKSVSRIYERTAGEPGFRFFGNVEVGRDVTVDELAGWYDAVVYAVGSAGDRRSGIPGEDLPGSWSATDFVGWYNGHPDYRDLPVRLDGERAVVVGNGNVALDVARMLVLGWEELRRTDIADHALEALRESPVREVVVLGRRGPEQAAFTNPELLELGELAEADVVVDPADLEIPDDLREAEPSATATRNVAILRGYAARAPGGKPKRVVLRFLTSPVEVLGEGAVEAVRVVRNELARAADGSLRARATERCETIEAGLVFRAIGYTGVPIAGLPFDDRRGVIPNDGGRVDGLPNTYVTGWIKRGPTGVIGTNKKCAQDTVAVLLGDLATTPRRALGADEVEARLRERAPALITYEGWRAIDAAEQAAGAPAGRPRVKLVSVEELLRAASSPRS